MGGRTDYPITLKLSSFARVAPQQGSLSPGALDQPIDSCEAGLPCTVMFNEAADMLECQTQPSEEPDQGMLHNGANILDLMFSADFERAAKQADRNISQQPAILWFRAATPECLRDRKP